MSNPVAVEATYDAWVTEGEPLLSAPFVGIWVYAKSPEHFDERIGMLCISALEWARSSLGDALRFTAQGKGWQKAVLVGKATTVVEAMALTFPRRHEIWSRPLPEHPDLFACLWCHALQPARMRGSPVCMDCRFDGSSADWERRLCTLWAKHHQSHPGAR